MGNEKQNNEKEKDTVVNPLSRGAIFENHDPRKKSKLRIVVRKTQDK